MNPGMPNSDFMPPDASALRLARRWLLVGVTALAIAGLFALVLVIARTPSLASIPVFQALFHKSLVVHVDLSVLVWFLAASCMAWSVSVAGTRSFMPLLEESALVCYALATLFIAFSPFDSAGEAMMSNYIPVIHSPVFFIGLSLLFCGTALMLFRLFTARGQSSAFGRALQFGLFSGGLITLVALAAFFWSLQHMPGVIDGTQYYELAFWGGGHLLQFTFTQVLLVVWIVLARRIAPASSMRPFLLYSLFAPGLTAAFVTPLIYLNHDVASQEHRQFFTQLMISLNGIAPLFLAVWCLSWLWQARSVRKGSERALWSSLMMSIVLFASGGLLGGMIQGQNVVIPAHYHGSIVGVTLGFMGFAYLLLPQFGYRDPASWRLAYWQPIVYGVGQLLHVGGLAWSGGYGVLRKTPGALEGGMTAAKTAMGLMGLGGLLAIIGGLMFVVAVARAVFYKD